MECYLSHINSTFSTVEIYFKQLLVVSDSGNFRSRDLSQRIKTALKKKITANKQN